jgi:hypothetical protein
VGWPRAGGWTLPILMAGVRGPGGVIWGLRGGEAVVVVEFHLFATLV